MENAEVVICSPINTNIKTPLSVQIICRGRGFFVEEKIKLVLFFQLIYNTGVFDGN